MNPSVQSHKDKFLAEVTSFTNAEGGDLILGISEDDERVPDELVGMEIDINDISIDESRTALVIRVRES